MGDNINTFAQQTATINNDFRGRWEDVTAQSDPERTYLLWNDDNTTVYVHGVTHKVKRDSRTLNDLGSAGRVDNGKWMFKREQHPVNVTNEIHHEMNMTAITNKLEEVITVMNSFDIQVNLAGIHSAIDGIAQRINFLQDEKKGLPNMLKLLEGVQVKLKDTNDRIKLLSDKYAEVAKSIETGDDKLIQNIGDLVNQQKAVIEASNRHLKTVETRLQGIENKPDPPAITDIKSLIPKQSEMRIDELIEFMKNQYNDFLK